ncbi:PucR family transcriptional regulator [Amycolatopsis rubida]|uniref:PucR C-terminal helix-turn-helix domain-containing protein n=1 Tax=Amycolatopsis rubida TaxID=112413 RepID=A0A1I5KCU5_9PSEU|nr:helix-turn-helix domain-containing protein [Amycolatopsis rubida]SFO82426.1 PucR C-terminal helix-turn-helix domain-containing protein [Amycolatopsis rubida]
MSDDDLQSIVDELAERLEQSVAIDDPAIRLLAASRHFGDEDPLRVSSVLNRSIPAEVSDPLFARGIASWTEPGVVDLDGALPRLCAPVRCDGLLLGYLWLIDGQGAFREAEFAAAAEAARQVGTILYRRLLLHQRSLARHEAILRELVSPDALIRAQAVEDLRAEELFPEAATRFTVVAVHCRTGGATPPPQEVALGAAVEEGLRAVSPDVALMAANRARAWILLARRRPPTRLQISAVTDRIRGRFARIAPTGPDPVFGIGTTVERLDEVAGSYRHASLAARAALLVPSVGDVACWNELGPYGLLLKLSADDLADAAEVPALAALEQEDNHQVLVRTLETFFDHGGNIRRTAEALKIHRATLYQRLKRVEQVTGRTLGNGDDRLTLHLGLKLRTLSAALREHLAGDEADRQVRTRRRELLRGP